jgi:cytochrome P450
MNAAAPLSPAIPKPAHVPDRLVYDFDAYRDPGLLADPAVRIPQMLREAPPIFWTPRNGGMWVIQGYEELLGAYRETTIFSSEFMTREQMKMMMPSGMPRIPQARPINLDPPEHTKYRAPLQKTFSPKSALALKDDIRKLMNELIDAVAPQGTCNYVTAVAEHLPVQVFIKMFGLPLERAAEYRQLAKEHIAGIGADPASMAQKSLRLVDVMKGTIEARQQQPREDILSLLWQARVDDQPTTMEVMEDYAVLLFVAGLDTVVNGMGLVMRHLATDPELQQALRDDPKQIVEAVEEMLRRYAFTVPVRRVARDADFEGVAFRADERVLMYDPAANVDPRKFDHAERVDVGREEKVHIAFGAGPHRCLGSHLARIELQVSTEVALARLRNIRLAPGQTPHFHGGHVIGPDALIINWDV